MLVVSIGNKMHVGVWPLPPSRTFFTPGRKEKLFRIYPWANLKEGNRQGWFRTFKKKIFNPDFWWHRIA